MPVFPVPDYTRVSSGIGARSSPGGIGSTNHQGIDIAAPLGSDIYAPVDMTVISAGVRGGFGNTVIGQDAEGNQHLFAHMNDIDVRQGQRLLAGSVLGGVGSTGNSTGSHLHYAVRDSAGKFLAGKTQEIINSGVSRAKDFVQKTVSKYLGSSATNALLVSNPAAGAALLAGKAVFGGKKSWIEEIKEWFEKSKFWQRLAIVVLALILIGSAFYLFGSGKTTKLLGEAVK